MDLEHSFTVPVAIDTAWAEFQDVASVAECFPGATVSAVEGDSFTGSVKVKLGPIALTYQGSGTFTEKDEAGHRFVVDAKGKDRRGNGTAGATVTLTMVADGDATDVHVLTDLAVTGKPAQFGRGVMQDASDKLLGQFVACLEQRLGTSGGSASDADETATPEAEGGSPETAVPPTPVAPATPPPAATPRTAPASSATPARSGDALDLGRTVLPVMAKAYWKPAVAALVVIVVVIWLLTR